MTALPMGLDMAAMDNPLNAAVVMRDRKVIDMVEQAIARRHMFLAYQPVFNAANHDQAVFYEGLMRLRDGSGRVIPAAQFIAITETSEIGRKIDCLALEEGLRALAQNEGLQLSVNMSARSIGYSPWTDTLEAGLALSPTIAERLILEVTEASAMIMPDIVSAFMSRLQSVGIRFALDDFGAGYTSFRYLRDLLFDMVKIDGQFIRDISESPDNQVLTSALVEISRHFDMLTIAEGVEQAEDAAFVRSMGVDCVQGYLFGAPTENQPWNRQNSMATA